MIVMTTMVVKMTNILRMRMIRNIAVHRNRVR